MHFSEWKIISVTLLALCGCVCTSRNVVYDDRISQVTRIVSDFDLSQDQGNVQVNATNSFSTRACIPNGDLQSCFQVIKGQLGRVYHQTFNNSTEFRFLFNYYNVSRTCCNTNNSSAYIIFIFQPNQTFSVRVESPNVKSSHPILFVVRQQKAVTSWELPLVLESASGRLLSLKKFLELIELNRIRLDKSTMFTGAHYALIRANLVTRSIAAPISW